LFLETIWKSTLIIDARPSSDRRLRCWPSTFTSWPIAEVRSSQWNWSGLIRAPAAAMPMRQSSQPSATKAVPTSSGRPNATPLTTPSDRISNRGRRHHEAACQRILRNARLRAPDAVGRADAARMWGKHIRLRACECSRCLFPRLPCGAGRGMLFRSQLTVTQDQSDRFAPQICRRDAC
jgi:hypothetical protein